MRQIDGTPLGGFATKGWDSGTFGWQTQLAGAAEYVLAGGDVSPPSIKETSDDEWTPLLVPGKVPDELIGYYFDGATYHLGGNPGYVPGTYHLGFGGGNPDHIYLTVRDQVISCTDGTTGRNFSAGAIAGLPVEANEGFSRVLSKKGATDPTNVNVYYIGMGAAGLRYTLDHNATMVTPGWCPAPNKPTSNAGARWTLVAVDPDSSATSAPVRKSRVFVIPAGRGVYMSTDGCATGADVTASSGITAASGLLVRNGKLYVCPADPESGVPTSKNLKVYNIGAGTWADLNISNITNAECQGLCADPRYTNGFWIVLTSGDLMHTTDGAAFTTITGGGYHENGNPTGPFCRTRAKHRPLVAKVLREVGASYAISDPITVNGKVYFALGLGTACADLADFPVTDALYGEPMSSAKWPDMEEDTANNPEIVGQCFLYTSGGYPVAMGEDIAINPVEQGGRGHIEAVGRFPKDPSDTHGASAGPIEDYAVARMTRQVQSAIGNFHYTHQTKGRIWVKMANQPTQGPSALYECGHGIAGLPGHAVCLPSRYGASPEMTLDYGATPWTAIDFYIGATKLNFTPHLTDPNDYIGFQGANFANQKRQGCYDPVTGDYWFLNIGATADQNAAGWESTDPDPRGWAGIYRMAANEMGIARRVYAGHPLRIGNFGYFTCNMVADGRGHLVIKVEHTAVDAGTATNMQMTVYDIAANTLRRITSPFNVVWMDFGAPHPDDDMARGGDGRPCLWMKGRSGPLAADFGMFYSRDLGVTKVGPFPLEAPQGGFMNSFAMHPTKFGVGGGSLQSRGHFTFELQARA